MGAMASQIASLPIVCLTTYSGTDQRKHRYDVIMEYKILLIISPQIPKRSAQYYSKSCLILNDPTPHPLSCGGTCQV